MTERVVVLDNGLTIAVDPMATTRAVSVGVWVGIGSRDEAPLLAGSSHFLEHLLFKGTAARSARDISLAVDRCGGDINAYTSREHTAFFCRLPARDATTAIQLLGEVIHRPALRDADVESERDVILEELAMDDDVPDDVVHRMFGEQMFHDHSLGRDPGGTAETVRALTSTNIRDFHAEHYTAERIVVAIAGGVDADEMIGDVERAFGSLRHGDGAPTRSAPGGMGSDLRWQDHTEQVHLVVGGRSLERDHQDREALDIVNHALGGGLSSRLFDEIRERRGLVYSVFSGISTFSDAGSWSVYAAAQPHRSDEVERRIAGEVDRMASGGPTEEELAVARGYLIGAYELGLEDSGARMSRLGGMLSTIGTVRSIDEQIERWNRVTLDDAARVAHDIFGGPRLTVALGPN
jgi:predicted Zn-dependent peptidase